MAHKKAGGSTSLGRDSQPKSLGVKLYAGQFAKTGNIILRQRGTQFRPGENVALGKDYTIFATRDGIVKFTAKRVKKFTNRIKKVKFVSVVEQTQK